MHALRCALLSLVLCLYVGLAGATTHVNDSGTWRQISEIHVNDAGTWRRIQQVYVNDAGTWRTVFIGDQITIPDGSAGGQALSPANAQGGYRLNSNGNIETQQNAGAFTDVGDWITPQVNMADYEVRCTVSSGATSAGSDICDGSTYLALSSSRLWTRLRTSDTPGTDTVVLSLSVRRASDGTVMDTATITITAEVI